MFCSYLFNIKKFTYENSQINAVDMHKEDLEASELITYPVQNKQIINQQN